MKKILILANNDVGLYNFRKELIEELIKRNYQVYISLPYGKKVDLLIDMGCKFIDTKIDRRGTNPIKDLKLLRNYYKIIRKINPDVILTYTIKPNIYGGIVCRILKKKCIANVTGLGSSSESKKIINGLIKKYGTMLKFSQGIEPYITIKFGSKNEEEIIIKEIKEFLNTLSN